MSTLQSLLINAIIAGTPILFATLGEIIIEKAGHLNLGVEGMMILGAVVGFIVGLHTKNPVEALLAAMLAGAFGALIYAFLTITLRANQVVSGLALTMFGTGFSDFIGKNVVGQATPANINLFFGKQAIPLLSHIPFLGPILFNQDKFVYLGYIITILVGLYLYHTNFGLNLKAVGENPAAADASSINVKLYKYVHILIGGALCGIGGAYLSLVYVPSWQENVTSGKGWIAVALVIFASWNPYKAIFGAYLFGGLSILGFTLQSLQINVSQYLVDMLPYIVTILVLILASLRKNKNNSSPKALGLPYFREER